MMKLPLKLPELTRSQRLLCMLSLTGSYFVVELVVGLMTNSLALVADSFHMASDVLALLVALVAIRIARRDSTPRYSYGFHRAELIGALANGVFLLGLCFTIAVDAIVRITRPEVIERPKLVFIVGLVGLAVNLLGLLLFAGAGHAHHGHVHSHDHGQGHAHAHEPEHGAHEADGQKVKKTKPKLSFRKGKAGGVPGRADSAEGPGPVVSSRPCLASGQGEHEHDHDGHDHNEHEHAAHNEGRPQEAADGGTGGDEATATKERRRVKNSSLNMRAVLLHVAGDALGSLVVVFTAVAIWKGNSSFVEKYLDPIASLIIVLILGYASMPLVFQAASVLLNAVPPNVDIEALRTAVLALPGVLGVHDLHIWQLSDLKLVASAHIRVSRWCSFMAVGSQIKEVFHAAGVHSVTVQPEFVEDAVSASAAGAPGADGVVADAGCGALDGESDCLLRCDQDACDAMACCPAPLRTVQTGS